MLFFFFFFFFIHGTTFFTTFFWQDTVVFAFLLYVILEVFIIQENLMFFPLCLFVFLEKRHLKVKKL